MLGTAGALSPCSFPAPFPLLSLLQGQVKLAEKEEGEGEEEEEEGRSGKPSEAKPSLAQHQFWLMGLWEMSSVHSAAVPVCTALCRVTAPTPNGKEVGNSAVFPALEDELAK